MHESLGVRVRAGVCLQRGVLTPYNWKEKEVAVAKLGVKAFEIWTAVGLSLPEPVPQSPPGPTVGIRKMGPLSV